MKKKQITKSVHLKPEVFGDPQDRHEIIVEYSAGGFGHDRQRDGLALYGGQVVRYTKEKAWTVPNLRDAVDAWARLENKGDGQYSPETRVKFLRMVARAL